MTQVTDSGPAKVIVVGGGLGGLLSACHLAAGGAQVRLLEGGGVGGRAAPGSLRDPAGTPLASKLNLGPRAVTRGGSLDQALRQFGLRPAGFSPSPGGFGLRDGQLHAMPVSPTTLLSSSLLGGAGLRAVGLALARVAIGAFDVDEAETIGAWIERHAAPQDARQLLAGLVRVSTYSADLGLDAGAALRQTRAAVARGVNYLDGGWSVIVDGLTAKARSLGVAIDEHTRAASVADGVVTTADGKALPADGVVVAGSPQMAHELLGLAVSSDQAVHAACLDLLLDKLPLPDRRFVLGIDRPLYFSVHSRPGIQGPVIIHAMAYGAATREELEAFVDVVQPGFRAVLQGARYLPKMIVAHGQPRPGAKTQAVVVDERTALVGDWLNTQGLIADGVAESAALAAAALLRSPRRAVG